MPQFSGSHSSSRRVRQQSRRGSVHTITSEEADSYPAADREQIQVSYPSSSASISQASSRPQHRNSEFSIGSRPPVRIRSPSPSRGNPAENAPTFYEWLQSKSGGRLSQEKARYYMKSMSDLEQEEAERKAKLERSVSDISRTKYAELAYDQPAYSQISDDQRTVVPCSVLGSRVPTPLPAASPSVAPSRYSSQQRYTKGPESQSEERPRTTYSESVYPTDSALMHGAQRQQAPTQSQNGQSEQRGRSRYSEPAYPSATPPPVNGVQRQQIPSQSQYGEQAPRAASRYSESVYPASAAPSLHGLLRQHREEENRTDAWVRDQQRSGSRNESHSSRRSRR